MKRLILILLIATGCSKKAHIDVIDGLPLVNGREGNRQNNWAIEDIIPHKYNQSIHYYYSKGDSMRYIITRKSKVRKDIRWLNL